MKRETKVDFAIRMRSYKIGFVNLSGCASVIQHNDTVRKMFSFSSREQTFDYTRMR